jgi:hypothetical protein
MLIEPIKDAMGHALVDFQKKGTARKLRIDSDISETDEIPVTYLFRDFSEMPPIEQTALKKCRGKILDVGAAAGSHSLWLQKKGIEVTAMDISGMACEVMKDRGVLNVVNIDFFESRFPQKFDTLLFLMNGIGICGTLDNLSDFFKQCKNLMAPDGQILIDSSDLIYMYGDEEEGYAIDLNGAYYGEVEYVMRYGKVKSNPFNWLFVDPATLAAYALQEGFTCDILLEGNHYDYLACLQLKK